MKAFEGKTVWHNGDPIDCSAMTATDCSFNQCGVRTRPGGWNRFSDIVLINAAHWNCTLSGAVIEEVSLHNLKKVGAAPLFIWASVFRHVKLSGRIAGLKINGSDLNPAIDARERARLDDEIRKYYSTVDWAIDISEAKFPGGITLEAIPGDLIIRDRITQKLVRRQNLASVDWRSMDYDQTAIDIGLSWFEEDSIFDSVVLVARSDPNYRARDLRVLEMLQAAGVAEPD